MAGLQNRTWFFFASCKKVVRAWAGTFALGYLPLHFFIIRPRLTSSPYRQRACGTLRWESRGTEKCSQFFRAKYQRAGQRTQPSLGLPFSAPSCGVKEEPSCRAGVASMSPALPQDFPLGAEVQQQGLKPRLQPLPCPLGYLQFIFLATMKPLWASSAQFLPQARVTEPSMDQRVGKANLQALQDGHFLFAFFIRYFTLQWFKEQF